MSRRWQEPERLEPELRRELGRFGPAGGMAELVAAWPSAVGETIARNAWPARLGRDGTLYVHTRDAVWAFELGHRAKEIAGGLGTRAPAKLRFIPGPLPEQAAEGSAEASNRAPEPTAQHRAAAAELTAQIRDEELRKLVARAAAASLAQASAGRCF